MSSHFYQPIPSNESSLANSPRTRNQSPLTFQADFSSLQSSQEDLVHSTGKRPNRSNSATPWKWATVTLAVIVVLLLGSHVGSFTTQSDLAAAAAESASSAAIDHASSEASLDANSTSPATAASSAAPLAVPPRRRPEDDIVLITKSGSATVYERYLVHLQARPPSLYQPNTLYVSDLPLQVGDATFWDALANVSSRIKSDDEFRRLRAESVGLMEGGQLLTASKEKDAGWKLDKYKFLPMMAEAWRRFPDRSWFVVVEADTFLFWKQLVRFLATRDAEEQLLFGHEVLVDFDGSPNTPFAHGGSGFVLSRALMEASFGSTPDYEHRWDDLVLHNGFGDANLCKVLWDTEGVNIHSLSKVPEVEVDMFHGDTFRDVPFGRWDWCKPVLTYHHVSPNDVARLYDFERRIEAVLPPPPPPPALASPTARKGAAFDHMILHSDVWDEFRPRFLRDALEAVEEGRSRNEEVGMKRWRSLTRDDDAQHVKTRDAKRCQAVCRYDAECLQWTFIPHGDEEEGEQSSSSSSDGEDDDKWGTCRYTRDRIRIGTYAPQSARVSGWFVKRIQKWGREQGCSSQRLLGSVEPAQSRS